MSISHSSKRLPVFCEDDLSALYRYMLSKKQPNGDRTIVDTKSVIKSKHTVGGSSKIEITSSRGNETVRTPQIMLKNDRHRVAQKNEVKMPNRKNQSVETPSRYEVTAKTKMTPKAANHDPGLCRISSSTSSTKKKPTASSTGSKGDGIVKEDRAGRKIKSPALPVIKNTLYPSESVVVGWRMNVPIGSGFINVGNTCYLNSTLQALFHVPSFVHWLVNDSSHARKCTLLHLQDRCLICPVAQTLHDSHRQSGSAIRPTHVYSRLSLVCRHLRRGSQEDAHEFLRYLLEGMERSYLERYKKEVDNVSKETTPIGQIFGGYIRTEVACLECGHVSTTFQHFQDLILDVQSASSVDEALDQYFATESLGDEYRCDKCKTRIAATKKFFLERPPKVLCVQLKRFETLGGKNNKHISLRQWVDLESYLHKSKNRSQLRYKLVSMILHHGRSSSCGHYTAVGLTSSSGYYLFDDSSVSPMLLNDVLKTNPYILMFELSPRSSLASPSTSSAVEHSRPVNSSRKHQE